MGNENNDYIEYFAKFHLEFLYRSHNLSFKKSESPDFLSKRNKIGLEVTRACIQEWKQRDDIAEKYFNQGMSFEDIKTRVELDCKHGFDGELYDIDGIAAYSPVKGMYDTAIHVENIIESIENKTEKLSKYEKCNEYWLYVWNFYLLVDEEMICSVNEHFAQMKQGLQFSRIYIRIDDKLYLLKKNKPFQIYKTNPQTYNYLRRQALLAVEQQTKK